MADLIRRDGACNERLRGMQEEGGGYDHDGISTYDLIELGLTGLVSEAGESPARDVGYDVNDIPSAGTIDSGGRARVACAVERTLEPCPPEGPQHCAEPVIESEDEGIDGTASVGVVEWSVLPSDVEDPDDPGSLPEDSLGALWLQPVPDVDNAPAQIPAPQDEVSSSERAVQLALEFLQSEGISSRVNLDLLADIIQERGWTSVQVQVRGLVRAGYDIAQVHRMFELTDAWLHCVDSDALAPERWHGGQRLTWVEAAQLLDFLGYDADIDQFADFLAVEKEIWQELRRSSGQLATFKNYLFGYRLSSRTQVDDGIWQVNLDAGDPRSFDGTRNSLCRLEWWDEPVEGNPWTLQQILGSCHDLGGLAEWLALESRDLFG